MFRIVTIAAIVALSIIPAQADLSAQTDTSAKAGPADRVNSMAVPVGDLDLSQPADARVLANRLRHAAEIVCPSVRALTQDGSTVDVAFIQHSNCVDQATWNAVDQARARQRRPAVPENLRTGKAPTKNQEIAMFRTLKIAAAVALIATTARAGTTAQAVITVGPGDIAIPFGDLDLTKPHDAMVLTGRIDNAAQSICKTEFPRGSVASPYYPVTLHDCIRRLNQDTIAKIPALQPEHLAHR